jgi:hypothetical protein
VGDHPIYDLLAAELAGKPAPDSLPEDAWDPFAFVDACQQAVRAGGAAADACRKLQQREWELLFDFCYRGAASSRSTPG